MYAARSRFATPFRRDDVVFPARAWLLVESLTEAQVAESALVILDGVTSPEDERLDGMTVINAQDFPAPAPASDSTPAPVKETVPAKESAATEG